MEFERLTFPTLESLLVHLNRGYFTSMQMNFPSKDAASCTSQQKWTRKILFLKFNFQK